MKPRILVVVICAALVLGACGRTEPLATPVSATSMSGLGRWRIKQANRFTLEEWREFDAALQEIRLRVMADREASGSEAVEEAMCARINGRSVREVLVLGYEGRFARLQPVRDELKRSLEGNALLVTKPGDRASASYLDTLRGRQEEQLRKTEAEIAVAVQRLEALGARAPVKEAASASTSAMANAGVKDASAGLPRDEAREQIKQMLSEQRQLFLLKYGPWPVKIDRTGAALTGADRAAFEAARAAAPNKGHVVIAVHLRERWWIYDGPAESPTFSKTVTANLTVADRREIEELWSTLKAETWARRTAQEELTPKSGEAR